MKKAHINKANMLIKNFLIEYRTNSKKKTQASMSNKIFGVKKTSICLWIHIKFMAANGRRSPNYTLEGSNISYSEQETL
jgi:phage antirepressor YoqD-like protein